MYRNQLTVFFCGDEKTGDEQSEDMEDELFNE